MDAVVSLLVMLAIFLVIGAVCAYLFYLVVYAYTFCVHGIVWLIEKIIGRKL